jgi:prolyl oligopeptidase
MHKNNSISTVTVHKRRTLNDGSKSTSSDKDQASRRRRCSSPHPDGADALTTGWTGASASAAETNIARRRERAALGVAGGVLAGLAAACSAPAHTNASAPATAPNAAAQSSGDAGACAGDPASPREPTYDSAFGLRIDDPYRWLENADSTGTKAWVEAQDEHARTTIARNGVRDELVQELERTRSQPTWTKMPVLRNGTYLYGRRDEASERGRVYKYDPRTSVESVVLDLDKTDLVARYWIPSPNGTRIAFLMSPVGGDALVCRVYDTVAEHWLSDEVPGFRYGFPVWTPDEKAFYYTWSPLDHGLVADKRAALSEIRVHRLGASAEKDEVVREASGADGTFEIPDVSPDGKWLTAVRIAGSLGQITYLAERGRRGPDAWAQLTPSVAKVRYDVTFGRKALYVASDDGAPNGRAFLVDPRHPAKDRWKEIVGERKDRSLEGISTIGQYVFFTYLKDAETYYEIRREDGTFVKEIAPPIVGMLRGLAGQTDSSEGSVALSTYTDPYQIYLFKAPNFELKPFPPSAPSAAPSRYVTEKVFATSPDGTRLPIFVVRATATPRRESAPLILYAYGAFGESTLPGFHRGLSAWLDRGGVYAEAVIRGGGEYGKEWHIAGMGKARKNVYDDFIAASEYLVKEGWTTPDRFVLRGASAGGLLVTVAETERPDLFRAVIAQVPVTDMTRYTHGHDNGTLWLEEFGSPTKQDEFDALYRYSPYHRIRRGVAYPDTLVLSSAEDDRVDPMHSRKFVAAMQDADPCGTILLRTESKAAHSGPTTLSRWFTQEADVYSFALHAVGVAQPSVAADAGTRVQSDAVKAQ